MSEPTLYDHLERSLRVAMNQGRWQLVAALANAIYAAKIEEKVFTDWRKGDTRRTVVVPLLNVPMRDEEPIAPRHVAEGIGPDCDMCGVPSVEHRPWASWE